MVGLSFFNCKIISTTAGVATFGFDPPMTPGAVDPVCLNLEKFGNIDFK